MESIDKDELARKKEYYNIMDAAMNDSDDDVPDPGRVASADAIRNAARPRTPKQKEPNSLSRSISDNQLDVRGKQSETSKRTTDRAKLPPSLAAHRTFPGPKTASPSKEVNKRPIPSKVTGKRKRVDPIQQIPVEGGIFSELIFYFFPNDARHPAREMRIRKAIEHGAIWERDFSGRVTHVIVEKHITYSQLLEYIKKNKLPQSMIVVSEDYPAECISYRALLDPRQKQFGVQGYEPDPDVRPVSAGSEKSLQLKQASKSVITRQPQTPEAEMGTMSAPSNASDDEEPLDNHPPPSATTNQSRATAPDVVQIKSTDEFDKAINQARQLRDVPLDPDDEAASRPTSSKGPGAEDESDAGVVQPSKPGKNKLQRFEDRFQCMQKHTGPNTENPNAATIAILQQMADYYGQVGDEWRLRAYRKAIASLRNHSRKVWTREEALALPQIGDRLATKIEEIAHTNRLRRLENAKAEPADQVFQTFMQIYDVGPAQASKWVDAGFTTLAELSEKADLTENQRIGLDHYEDFNSKIPRAEVEEHGRIVKETLQKIDPAFDVIVGGSYRRGSDTSGDIDCIITRSNTGSQYIRRVVVQQLVPKLFAKKFLVVELAGTSRDDGSKWHGASQLPPATADGPPKPWRRIDFLLVPSDELGAALIYFTGNDIFNRSMRLLAGTNGMRLNQRGLYKDVVRGKGREKLSEGTLVEGKDEKKIFEILGVPWRPPEHRIC